MEPCLWRESTDRFTMPARPDGMESLWSVFRTGLNWHPEFNMNVKYSQYEEALALSYLIIDKT